MEIFCVSGYPKMIKKVPVREKIPSRNSRYAESDGNEWDNKEIVSEDEVYLHRNPETQKILEIAFISHF